MQNVYRAEAAGALFAFEAMRRKVDELSRRNEALQEEIAVLRAKLEAAGDGQARRVPQSGTYATVRPPSLGGEFEILPLRRVGGA
jgi:hypothetical protein